MGVKLWLGELRGEFNFVVNFSLDLLGAFNYKNIECVQFMFTFRALKIIKSMEKRPQFGNRFLPKSTEDADEKAVFEHNAWSVSKFQTVVLWIHEVQEETSQWW